MVCHGYWDSVGIFPNTLQTFSKLNTLTLDIYGHSVSTKYPYLNRSKILLYKGVQINMCTPQLFLQVPINFPQAPTHVSNYTKSWYPMFFTNFIDS